MLPLLNYILYFSHGPAAAKVYPPGLHKQRQAGGQKGAGAGCCFFYIVFPRTGGRRQALLPAEDDGLPDVLEVAGGCPAAPLVPQGRGGCRGVHPAAAAASGAGGRGRRCLMNFGFFCIFPRGRFGIFISCFQVMR